MALTDQFRSSFAAGLHSGNYDEPKETLTKLIWQVKTVPEFFGCLDALCDLFDPRNPPRRAGLKPSDRPQWKKRTFYLGVAVLENLLNHGLELSKDEPQLAREIFEIAEVAVGSSIGGVPRQRVWVYADRFRFISEIQRAAIHKLAAAKLHNLAEGKKTARLLIDDLAAAFKDRTGSAHQGFDELYRFEIGDEAGRARFHRAAQACEKAWMAALKARDFKAASDALTKAFEAFQQYIRREMKQPIDLFRLLKWAREPGETTMVSRRGGGTQKLETAEAKSASAFFSVVKDELYLEIASHGLTMAIGVWQLESVQHAFSRARTAPSDIIWKTAWQSGATGFEGRDAQYVFAPIVGEEARNLFRARLLAMQMDPKENSPKLQNQRRSMEILASLRHLTLVDEVKLVALSKEMEALMRDDPIAHASRSFELTGGKHHYGTFHIGDGYSGAFSIFWIAPQPTGTIYVEFRRFPGYVFMSPPPPDRTLADLVEAAQLVDIGESWEALKGLAVAYLIVLGFALDVISAGIAGNTLRGAVLHFLAERIAEKVIDKSLELSHLNHPLLQFVTEAIVGAKLGKSRKLLSLDELEQAERSATRSVTRPTKPAAKEAANDVLDNGLSKKARGLSEQSAQPAGENLFKHSAHVYSYEPSSTAYRLLPQERKDQLIKDQLAELDDEPSWMDRMTDVLIPAHVQEFVPGRVPAQASLGHGIGTQMLRTGDALKSAKATGKKGGAKVAPSGAPSKKQTVFSNSRVFRRLDEYSQYLTKDIEIELKRQRTVILHELNGIPPITMSEARKRMMHIVNLAKEDFGELHGEMTARSNFDIVEGVNIPTRGEGAPMLDWVGKLTQGSKLNRGLRFVLVEAKGGAHTRLGKVSSKVYQIDSSGRLSIKSADNSVKVKQASGEWYYQKIAEIYMSGDKLEGVERAARRKLALELFEASKEGKVACLITKFGKDAENLTLNTDEVVKWFRDHVPSKGFPSLI